MPLAMLCLADDLQVVKAPRRKPDAIIWLAEPYFHFAKTLVKIDHNACSIILVKHEITHVKVLDFAVVLE
jgi:hypothetical protein